MPVCPLHLTGNAWESELPRYECLLPLPLPSTQEWWEKHNGWEHYSALPPLAFKRPADRTSSREAVAKLTSLPFPPPENKQRKSTLLRNALPYSRIVRLLLLEFFESDSHEKDTFEEGMEMTCCDPTRIFDPQQWVTPSVLSVQWFSFALLIQSLPDSPAHIVSALASLHTCSVW